MNTLNIVECCLRDISGRCMVRRSVSPRFLIGGTANEIDLIAIEKLDRRATIEEVKRNKEKYNPQKLEKKYERIKHNLRGYKVELIGLSMEEDM